MLLQQNSNNYSNNRSHRDLSEIYLAKFDPDDHQLTVGEWCKQVDSLINLRGYSPQIALMKALSCLKGRTKTWADINAHELPDWTDLKRELISQFSAETRHIYFVTKFREYTSNDAKNYAEYVTEAWRLFARISPNAPNDLMVEAVISGIHSSQTKLDTDLTDTTELEEVLFKHSSTFGMTSPIRKVKTGTLNIRLKDPSRIVQRRPYRLASVEKEKVNIIIDDLKAKGIIRDSCSPFASPILLVKKKNGDDRLCVDYRELNSNTIRDNYPLPLIQDQINILGSAKYFTTLDMESGFHQIPINEESIEKTAFVTPDGQYEYVTMPFGLCNSPSVYQRAINKALGDYKDKIALVYIDDVLIPSETIQEVERLMHTIRDHLGVVSQNQNKTWLTKLGELQLCINTTKSKATGHAPLELLIGKKCSPPAIQQLTLIEDVIDRDGLRKDASNRMAEQAIESQNRFVSHEHVSLIPTPKSFESTSDDDRDKRKQGTTFVWKNSPCDFLLSRN
ncbi:hypothetical protein ABMA28_012390 [Loxostege sticticalis]|uniref:Reverse transcriptase domain-containing protein n=1 Tax=Loxostege sticticalis TaxID=481309 RepID=A0ABD0TMU1_LOXSC